ncbi:MAG: hypothetical protein Q4C50_06515 [Eubacteriales bacterium]|nr:hypothetical protein [Eubacteriales bacterium]
MASSKLRAAAEESVTPLKLRAAEERMEPLEGETFSEIHVDRMHFRVASRHPRHTEDIACRMQQGMRKELYEIFRKYV